MGESLQRLGTDTRRPSFLLWDTCWPEYQLRKNEDALDALIRESDAPSVAINNLSIEIERNISEITIGTGSIPPSSDALKNMEDQVWMLARNPLRALRTLFTNQIPFGVRVVTMLLVLLAGFVNVVAVSAFLSSSYRVWIHAHDAYLIGTLAAISTALLMTMPFACLLFTRTVGIPILLWARYSDTLWVDGNVAAFNRHE